MRLVVAALAIAAVGCVPMPVPADEVGPPGASVETPSFDPFYGPLAPYGDWWWSARYGWVFSPSVPAGWRPYTVGHWLLSDEGWTWNSDEPFGWACFHYGRWTWLDDAGWAWVPGRVWAPAWVIWRSAPGYVGWGPIGPSGVVAGSFAWVFVPERRFVGVRVVDDEVPMARNPDLLPSSRVIHRPSREALERESGRGIPVHRVARDGRLQEPGDVVIRRAPRVEPRHGGVDIPGPGGARFSPGEHVVRRPLSGPSDDDIDRRYDAMQRRVPDGRDRRALEDNRAREKRAAEGRRTIPRAVPRGAPHARPRHHR